LSSAAARRARGAHLLDPVLRDAPVGELLRLDLIILHGRVRLELEETAVDPVVLGALRRGEPVVALAQLVIERIGGRLVGRIDRAAREQSDGCQAQQNVANGHRSSPLDRRTGATDAILIGHQRLSVRWNAPARSGAIQNMMTIIVYKPLNNKAKFAP
jgi:hypothetical protein